MNYKGVIRVNSRTVAFE